MLYIDCHPKINFMKILKIRISQEVTKITESRSHGTYRCHMLHISLGGFC